MEPYVTTETLVERTRAWIERVGPVNRSHLRIDASASALLVIDMQRYFLEPESPSYTCGGPAVLPTVKRLIDAFRAARRPVIFTRHVHRADGSDAGIMGWWWRGMCVEGTPESEVHPTLAPLPAEPVILKRRYSAFANTDLETVLRGLGVEDLVVCGVMTNMCCETTARDAYQRDHRVFFPADANGSVNEEMHLASLLNLAFGFACVTTADELITQVARHDHPPSTRDGGG
ncbi:MAG TPA: isochorismatase family cysteine hydrolase [Chthonomonadales bacterium]|nr:isochorismatase family cysteine hydrolase [Chthonomonadales bacterium]